MYERILIALEGNETDVPVLDHVQTLAAQARAQVILLQVITVADDGDHGWGRSLQLEIGSSGWRRSNRARAYGSQLQRRLQRAGLQAETVLLVSSRSEADEIVSYADEHECDLIAMASDSRPWWRRWREGSVAGSVQRQATVPTLFISDGTRSAPAARKEPKANPMMALFGNPCL